MQTDRKSFVLLLVTTIFGGCGGSVADVEGDETHFASCNRDSECPASQRCVDGRCQMPPSATEDRAESIDRGSVDASAMISASESGSSFVLDSNADAGSARAPQPDDAAVPATHERLVTCGVELVVGSGGGLRPPESCERDSGGNGDVIRYVANDGVLHDEGCGNAYGIALPAEADVPRTLSSFEPCVSSDGSSGGWFAYACDEVLYSCRHDCVTDADCPSGGSGTAEPLCDGGRCSVSCDTAVCPDGMRCASFSKFPMRRTCWWPMPY